MPRQSKGARLWLRPVRRRGKSIANAVWIIIDGNRHIATGCVKSQAREAERQLAAYIAEKYQPSRHARDIDRIDIADVLSVYLEDCGPRVVDQPKLERCIGRLNDYWGGKMLSQITAAECRAYVKQRGRAGGARADLETLRAAINHHAKENLHYGIVRITLPPKGPPRDRWLTRSEAAKLIWACWRYRERQTVHRGRHKGQLVATDKRPLRHLARFILIGLYTGTRRDCVGVAVSPRWSLVRRSGPGHLLPTGHWPPRHQQAADAHADTAAAHSPYATLGSARHRHFPLCGMARGAGQIGQDRLQARGQTCWFVGQSNTAYAAAHGGDLADATWRTNLAGCRLSRHVRRNGGAHLRPPPSGVHARRCAGDHVETIAERFIGHSIGQAGKRGGEATKNLMKSWWAREDSNLQPSGYEPLALTIELRARATHAPRGRAASSKLKHTSV